VNKISQDPSEADILTTLVLDQEVRDFVFLDPYSHCDCPVQSVRGFDFLQPIASWLTFLSWLSWTRLYVNLNSGAPSEAVILTVVLLD